jgi:F420-dependent oxidoreductase-like protein
MSAGLAGLADRATGGVAGRLPRIGLQIWGQSATWPELMAAGRDAESVGLHSVWSNDHFLPLIAAPDGARAAPGAPIFEGWSLLAGWAGVTTRVRLGCLVSGAGYRNPGLLVKQATAFDHLSDGRLTLGLGAGWFETEHRAFGFAFLPLRERLDRLEEAAAICRGLLDGERVTYEGRWYSAAGAVNDPPPLQARLPLLIGGNGERRTLPIVARYADVWSADGGDPETIARKQAILDAACDAVGRDPAAIRRTAGQPPPIVRGDEAEARGVLAGILQRHGLSATEAATSAADDPFAGTIDTLRRRLETYGAVGVEEVMFDWPPPFDQATLEALGRLAETSSSAP